jgi:hypothetical protein
MISSGRRYCFLRRRVELQQLDQLVLEHHLARRDGDVPAQLEGGGVGHLDAQLAVALLDVAQQVVEALEQVLAVRLHRLAEDLRVGQGEVRGRQGVDVLAREEVHLLLGLDRQPFDIGHHVMDVARRDEVGLLDEVEEEVLLPLLVLEAAVALLGHRHRLGLQPGEAQHRVLPQREVVPHQVHLRLRQPVGIGEQLGHHVHEGLGDAQFVAGRLDPLLQLALHVLGDQLGSALGDFGVGVGDFLRVGQGRFVGRLGGHHPLLSCCVATKRNTPASCVRRRRPACSR